MAVIFPAAVTVTVYMWLIHSKLSRLNLISLSASCVEPGMISPDVYPLVTPSGFFEEMTLKKPPGFSQDSTMENVPPSFSTFQASQLILGSWLRCSKEISQLLVLNVSSSD